MYYKGLKTVTYSSNETREIEKVSQQQGIKAYVPDKMGGSSGYYIPGSVIKGSSHSMRLQFEDTTFYEAPSWKDIKQALSPQGGAVSISNEGSYTLSGKEQGQWSTLNYSDGARSDIFALRKGSTWVGIVPNPAKSTEVHHPIADSGSSGDLATDFLNPSDEEVKPFLKLAGKHGGSSGSQSRPVALHGYTIAG